MAKFTIIIGSPCTGKSTKFTEIFDNLNKTHKGNIELVNHTFYNKKKDREITKQLGYFYPEINLMLIGSMNKRGMLQGLDVITNSGGLSMDLFDDFLRQHNDKNIFTEANGGFSPARKMPDNIHNLGFAECHWILLMHDDRRVLDERKNKRAIESKTGRIPSQKSLDTAWTDNETIPRIAKRFEEQALEQDTIKKYKSTTKFEVKL